jgi:ethanolamine ammonia-lyase small subunit
MNAVGDLLKPKVVLLLIGERPGPATAESLSAYMAFKPGKGDNDAQRNLISNIHERGVTTKAAAMRIVNLAQTMMTKQLSGVHVKEALESPKWLDQTNGKEKSLK